ncbi:S-adenosyl-L-methionine-dependent methyltransferase [Cadophora sp. MPI-SDFR-AT-0126]|nr:S-adenosyl-L-methionine-dependent methyltransferase [Leotiomycetes sp. MPI-SDFR-AT-0126]
MSAPTPQAPPEATAPQDLGAPIEADADTNIESDSAYETSLHTFSTSISSSVFHYKYENGRRYHAFRDGEYPLPNDEKEQDRLDLLHHIFKLMLSGTLFIAPIPPNPQRVLDFGTGTGIWALDMADENPGAEVIGTDLSPIQPTWVPPNCRFIVDDVEDEWVYSDFDFVHGRGMAGSIKNWETLYARVLKNLKRGGYLEMQEYETWARSDDDEKLENCPCIKKWQQHLDEASRAFGKRMNVAAEQKEKLVAAGFEDVTEVVQKVRPG